MKNSKTTKRALFSSVMSLLLCVSMLIGTTFAWFTDTASTGVNKIVAGNLDVELEMWDGSKYINISQDKAPIFGAKDLTIAQNNNLDTLWEPGKTQVAYLAIKNEGNLALKYKVNLNTVNPADGNNLYKVMQYQIVPGAKDGAGATWTAGTGKSVALGSTEVSEEVTLNKGETHYFALLIHMDENADSTYENGKVEFDITVNATQDDVEDDSFGNSYDKYALYQDYIVAQNEVNISELVDASEDKAVGVSVGKDTSTSLLTNFKEAKEVTIIGADKETSRVLLKQDGYISTQNSKLVFKNVTVESSTKNYQGIAHTESIVFEDCIINGTFWGYANNITFKNCTFNVTGDHYNIWTYTSNVNFEDCTFNSNGKSVLIYNESKGLNHNVNFENCEFTAINNIYDKAAIEISGEYSNPTVKINNCTQEGFGQKGIWFVKNTLSHKPIVNVNGVPQKY